MFYGLDKQEKRILLFLLLGALYPVVSTLLFLPVCFAQKTFTFTLWVSFLPKVWWLKLGISTILTLVLSLMPTYNLKNIKAKEVGDGQHGKAHFATEEEKKHIYTAEKMGKEKVGGFVVGIEDKQWIVDPSDMNMMLLAPPGAGKTTRVIIPTIYYNAQVNVNTEHGASMILTDLKGELLNKTAFLLKNSGYEIVYINLRTPFQSYFYNIMQNTNKYMDEYLKTGDTKEKLIAYGKAERYAKILSQSLVRSIDVDTKSDTSSYFNNTAEGLLTGITLLVSEYGQANERHILSVFRLIIDLNGMATDSQEAFSPNQKSKMSQLLDHIQNPRIKNYVGPAMSADAKTSMNVFSSALGSMVELIDAEMEQMISRHSPEIDVDSFISKPTAVFIVCPDENPTRYFFGSLFLCCFLNDLIEKARMSSRGVLDRKVLCLWDEFGNMPAIKNVDVLFSAARSAGIRVLPVLQSLGQLEKSYNKNTAKIIRETCQMTLFTYVSPLARETAEEFSKVLGNQTIQSGTISMGGKSSQTIQMISKPLLSVDDIINMKQGEFVLMKSGSRPIQTNLPYCYDYFSQAKPFYPNHSYSVEPISYLSVENIEQKGNTSNILYTGMFD